MAWLLSAPATLVQKVPDVLLPLDTTNATLSLAFDASDNEFDVHQ
jgi:hypothetical protein